MTPRYRIGLSAYDMDAVEFTELAVAAEQCGFDTLWLGEHIIAPESGGGVHPTTADQPVHHLGSVVDSTVRLIDPLTTLAAAAARTSRIFLATGIYLLPLRHPLATARIASTVQDLARGRFLLGVGAGWLQEEFDALGVEFRTRFGRFEESIAVLREAWAGGWFSRCGTHYSFGRVQVVAEPVAIPLVLGGNSGPALRRAARLGDAWLSSGTLDYENAARLRDAVEAACAAVGRTEPLRCWFRIERLDPALIDRFTAEGMTDLVVWADQLWRGPDLDARRAALAEAASHVGLGLQVRADTGTP
ncbi:TIGR03619 family F420-dependent LLM class oxidoreductase [Streptomyces viridosporus]|nr:TIGR03619 family F420-dependent LLM class oxidoreductase [Streptomyces viridosporus]QEU83967.1 TIGR03619 family F420-dependent LLM class oxidoreductase [Streptomyces viridosporus T7A]